jgi:putative tryptophan/tyrosine transport system substrate-binding protein
MASYIARRKFLATLGGGAAAWPIAARAQQSAMAVIGSLASVSAAGLAQQMAAFHRGLSETGYVEGRNVAVEYRWAEGQLDRLPANQSAPRTQATQQMPPHAGVISANILLWQC